MMTEKIVYTSNTSPINVGPKTVQLFEITQVPGKIKGLREFKFENLFQFPNGTRGNHIGILNVVHLRNLLDLLKRMEAEGFLDNENVE